MDPGVQIGVTIFGIVMLFLAIFAMDAAGKALVQTQEHREKHCIHCPDCMAWVSRDADSCPNCGRPIRACLEELQAKQTIAEQQNKQSEEQRKREFDEWAKRQEEERMPLPL